MSEFSRTSFPFAPSGAGLRYGMDKDSIWHPLKQGTSEEE